MEINKAEFITSVANKKNLIIDERKQVAFVGRSNVGKSSLINMLTKQKKLAKTSSTPGRTRLINYFLTDNNFYFVDLPGYGFAKGNKEEIGSWQDLIEPYLVGNPQLKLICMLVDSRINPMDTDLQMQKVLDYYKIPYIVIATKCDKLSKSELSKARLSISNSLRIGLDNVIMCSADKNIGRIEILKNLELYLGA